MFRKLNKRAQTTAEYAILIALVVGAVVAMQVYVKRGIQGRIKDVVDHTGPGGAVGGNTDILNFSGNQYEPYYLKRGAQSEQNAQTNEQLGSGGEVDRQSDTESDVKQDQEMGWRQN